MAFHLSRLLAVLDVGRVDTHELRPSYPDLRQTGSETFEVGWKVPTQRPLLRHMHMIGVARGGEAATVPLALSRPAYRVGGESDAACHASRPNPVRDRHDE